MNRRRKHGDSPAASAAEEPGLLGSRARRRERRERRERRAAAEARDRDPGERYETPTRVLKMDLSSTFSSPNDQDGQNDIFWDQNSPMTKQLGKGRKQQIPITENDEIAHIVNRIAPQDEKPVTDSMLGVWIGASAIPCTPNVAKEQSRGKVRGTKLKTQNRVKELMKLAEQFDKNMEELDVIQEQHSRNHDSVQTASETEILHNCNDYVQKQSFDTVPEIDSATIKNPMKRITRINDSDSNQFDPNAEAAFNAIFDGSTQKYSGQLSQGSSEAFLNSSYTTPGKKSVLKEEKNVTSETLVTENQPNRPVSPCPQVDTAMMPKPHVTPWTRKPETSDKHADIFSSGDFEDDWSSLLDNEPFVLNPEMLELFPSTTAQVTDHQGSWTVLSKNDKDRRTNTNLVDRLRDSKIAQDLPSSINNRQLVDARGNRFSPNPNDESSKLPFTRNKMKYDKSFNKTVIQDKIQDCVTVANLTEDDSHFSLTSNAHALNKAGLNTGYTNKQKCGLSFNQSLKSSTSAHSLGSASLSSETSVGNPKHTTVSKLGSVLDDWNDPSFANEIIKACHQLEIPWEADDVDDDVLYQACDDIERLTQQGSTDNSRVPESTLEISNRSQHGARSVCVAGKPGSLLMQSKPSSLNSMPVQTSLTNKSQVNKSMKMEKKETCRAYQDFSDATTNVSVYSKNPSDQINNLHPFCNNIVAPIQVNSPKSTLAESSSLSVPLNHVNTELATKKKSSAQQLPRSILVDETPSSLKKRETFSKYTFTKIKNHQFPSQFSQDCIAGSMNATKIAQDLEKNKIDSSSLGKADQQLSESWKQPSREEEEKNRKCSPEEIQRKRQEALVRRMAKARTSFVNSAPT